MIMLPIVEVAFDEWFVICIGLVDFADDVDKLSWSVWQLSTPAADENLIGPPVLFDVSSPELFDDGDNITSFRLRADDDRTKPLPFVSLLLLCFEPAIMEESINEIVFEMI